MRKALSILILIALVTLNYNISRFGHYHITSNGYVIYHSHFSANPNTDFHTNAELIYLDQISNIVAVVSIIAATILFLFYIFSVLKNHSERNKNFEIEFSKQLRAPPVFSK